MTALTTFAVAISAVVGSFFQAPACELVDLPTAEALFAESGSEITGGAHPSMCQYMSASGLSLLIVQVTEEEYYDIVGVPEPHTEVDIGERARYGTDEAGDITLQFVKGGFHVSLKLVPNPDGPDPLEALQQVARTAADRIP
ncbi:MAG: hypothetical protein OEU54_06770 [Gemmatimonadota bacterium]|nr:hypothetical protein [Gemmatimonadota bacterium]